MENREYLEELLSLFNLEKGAYPSEIIEKYLEKTLQIKFQRILISEDALKEEFVRYHEAFIKILSILKTKDQKLKMSLFSSDQMEKYIFNQGVYALCKDNYMLAGEKFSETYKMNKQNIFLLIYLGIILTMRKNYYAAEKYFADAIKRDPENNDVWFYAAANLFKAGSYKKACDYFEKAKKLNPANNEIAFGLKNCREAMLKKTKPKGKETLLRRFVKYIRNAFED